MSMQRDLPSDGGTPRANSGYASEQLRRALASALEHSDPAVRAAAEAKVLAWEAVLGGMASGRLEVGSRTPVADTPAWVTLEVVHGGFATGRSLAEGPLTDEERQLVADLAASDAEPMPDRFRLNRWYLSDEGLARLVEALRSGHYVIDIPEEGALLVVAWLLQHGHEAAALDLVAAIFPLMDRLRFYPSFRSAPAASGAVARLETAGQVVERLHRIEVPDQLATMNDSLGTWLPLYDRLVDLWEETAVGDQPGAVWPEGWSERRQVWLDELMVAEASHPIPRRYTHPRSTFATLRGVLQRAGGGAALATDDETAVRTALHRSAARWGAPGSAERMALRRSQAAVADRPTNVELAGQVADRLAAGPASEGVSDLAPITAPVQLDRLAEPVPLPGTIVRTTQRALEAPIEQLVTRGIIPSSEVLAEVVPQISSHVAAAAFADPELRDLYTRIYSAFRRRRSLLLLDLQQQVQIGELPWVAALDPVRVSSSETRDRAVDTLRHVTLLAFTSFPQTILPNALLTEVRALARQADLAIPLVEEVAADIFMGRFTKKWPAAAAIAAVETEGTLYARYYDLPPASTWAVDPPRKERDPFRLRDRLLRRGADPAEPPTVAAEFAVRCSERAKEAGGGDGSWVARQGAVLEQSQILTTQNLAPIVAALDLRDRLAARAEELAGGAFAWVVSQQAASRSDRYAELRMLKNGAYAWRQAIYFLSLVDEARQREALARLRSLAAAKPGPWLDRFEPAILGLEAVVGGEAFGAGGVVGGGRRYLGWSIGPHWLAAPRRRSDTD